MPIPSTAPTVSPRRWAGALPSSQVSDPTQVPAPATPCVKRAVSSAITECDRPKPMLAQASRKALHTVARLAPTRATNIPNGMAETSVPIA